MDFLYDTLWSYPVYENEHTLDIIKAMFIKETDELIESYRQDTMDYRSRIQDAEALLLAVQQCETLDDFQRLEYTIFESTELLGSPNVQ